MKIDHRTPRFSEKVSDFWVLLSLWPRKNSRTHRLNEGAAAQNRGLVIVLCWVVIRITLGNTYVLFAVALMAKD